MAKILDVNKTTSVLFEILKVNVSSGKSEAKNRLPTLQKVLLPILQKVLLLQNRQTVFSLARFFLIGRIIKGTLSGKYTELFKTLKSVCGNTVKTLNIHTNNKTKCVNTHRFEVS